MEYYGIPTSIWPVAHEPAPVASTAVIIPASIFCWLVLEQRIQDNDYAGLCGVEYTGPTSGAEVGGYTLILVTFVPL
jgi:hypothetical protein